MTTTLYNHFNILSPAPPRWAFAAVGGMVLVFIAVTCLHVKRTPQLLFHS